MGDQNASGSTSMFKWACFSLAVVSTLALGWAINDLRLELKRTTDSLNESLPKILAHTKQSTETLAVLSQDIRQMRDLAGVTGGDRDRSLVIYTDSVLDFIEAAGGKIGLKPKLFGTDLKDVLPTKEWVVGARKEGVVLAFRARSRREILERLSNNLYGSPWYLQLEGQPPVALLDWLKEHHPPTREIE